jgi:pyruvate kinase
MDLSFNKTKILATVGPASNTPDRLLALMNEGVNAFRLNFSHGAYSEHQKVIDHVRNLNQQHNRNICLVQDLQGPKIRLGDVENGAIEIKEGQRIKLVCDGSITIPGRLSTIYKDLAKDVNPGDAILLDDGKLEVKVISTDKNMEVEAEVIYGGTVKPRKGINLPDSKVSERRGGSAFWP